MAISPKNEEKLEDFEAKLRAQGELLSAQQISEIGGATLSGKKLEDGLRVSLYVESLRQRDQNPDWDRLLPVDAVLERLRDEL